MPVELLEELGFMIGIRHNDHYTDIVIIVKGIRGGMRSFLQRITASLMRHFHFNHVMEDNNSTVHCPANSIVMDQCTQDWYPKFEQ